MQEFSISERMRQFWSELATQRSLHEEVPPARRAAQEVVTSISHTSPATREGWWAGPFCVW
jgi:hypothetical protein